jgi:hypothetical protein
MASAPVKSASTENPELASRFNRVLDAVVGAMEESGLSYAFIGGVASGGLGRPRSTFDIDLFVHPEDAEIALRTLQKKGFEVEKTDPSWLYKAFREEILVDVIFKSKGEIYYDLEMRSRVVSADFHGKKLRFVSPEDLLIIKAAAYSEATPGHWHDAMGLLSHASLDWGYLLRRARRAPRRVLSLLLYAQSNDVWVPNQVIHELYLSLFGDASSAVPQSVHRQPRQAPLRAVPEGKNVYATAHLREALARDSRTHELDILIEHEGDTILLRGDVACAERRAAVEAVAREIFPNMKVENQVRVINLQESTTEKVR